MAKNNTTKNNGYKVVAVVLAVVFLAAFLVAGFGSSWFKNGDITTWFNSWGTADQPQTGKKDDFVSDSLVVNSGEGYGISCTARALSADEYEDYGIEAQTLNAIVFNITLNDDATDKTLEASLTFKDDSSTWASEKTVSDYVTAEVNGLRVTASCKEAFGEQIILKVSSVDDPTYFLDLKLDFVKSVTSGSIRVMRGSTSMTTYYTTITAGDNQTYTPTIVPSYGVGTLTPNITITESKMAIAKTGGSVSNSLYHHSDLRNYTNGEKEYVFDGSFVCDTNFFLNFVDYNDVANETKINNEFIKICDQIYREWGCLGSFLMTVTYSVTYGGNTISEPKTATSSVVCETQNLKIGVTEISSDKDGGYFY